MGESKGWLEWSQRLGQVLYVPNFVTSSDYSWLCEPNADVMEDKSQFLYIFLVAN